MLEGKTIIEARELGFDYGAGWVFHKLNLEITEGDFVAVIGANGAGKSTLIKMLANVVAPTTGEIFYYGKPISSFQHWDKVGLVPQNPAKQQQNFPISVEEVVKLGLLKPNKLWQSFGTAEKEALEKALTTFDLLDLRHRRIGDLSGGQQQRVFLARAMVKHPEILFLDEPATGIDSAAKIALYDMLRTINREQNVTIVMVSHDLDLASLAAKSALCINHGICFRGDMKEAIKHHHAGPQGFIYK